MIIGCCELELYLPSCNSLKDKRAILNRIKTRARNKFNISIAETDHQDVWRTAVLSIVTVSSDKIRVEQVLDNMVKFVESFPELEIRHYGMEIL